MPVNLGYPFATLTVNADKSVTRTQVTNDTGAALQWVVLYNGKVVLQRNARNETSYKYFRSDPGVYTFYLEQYIDSTVAYQVISNVVSYTLP